MDRNSADRTTDGGGEGVVGPVVSVIIVTYNSARDIGPCLNALERLTDAPPYEVVVIDNGSSDGTADLIEAQYPDVRLVRSSENLGFSGACNKGAKQTTGKYIMLVNPDARVAPRCMRSLVDFLETRQDVAIAGGRAVNRDGTVDPTSCWGAPSLWSMACFATGFTTTFRNSPVFNPESLGKWARDSERRVDIVTGFLLMCRRRVWDELGGLDEAYFLYAEDADFCIRAARVGFAAWITPDAEVEHAGGASSPVPGRKASMLLRGKVTLMLRLWPTWRAFLGIRLLLFGVWLRSHGSSRGKDVPSPWADAWRARDTWRRGW